MSDQFNAVRGVLTAGGVGNITLSAAAAGKGQSPSLIPVGWSGGIRFDAPDGATWELTRCTMASSLVLSRDTVLAGSSGPGVKVNLPAGTTALQTALAEDFTPASDIAFTTTVPITNTGGTYMTGVQPVTGALTFTPAAGAVRGAFTFAYLKANGTNVPDVSAFTEHGGSMGYLNTANILNIAEFFNLAGVNWVSWSQAAVPVAIVAPSTVTLSGPTTGVINTASSNYTVGTDGVRTSSVTVTPTPVTNVTFAPTSVTLTAGTGTATFTATSTTIGAKSVAVTNNGGLANPSAITWTVAAAATAPGAPTIGTAVPGDTTASFPFTAPASDGGSAITGYELKVYDAGTNALLGTYSASSSPAVATGRTNGVLIYGKVAAINAVGTGAQSAASNSVTPASGSTNVRLSSASLSHVTESGSGPYTYTGDGTGYGGAPGPGGVATVAFQSGVDGSVQLVTNGMTSTGEIMLGLHPTATLQNYGAIAYAIYAAFGAGIYRQITAGSMSGAVPGAACVNSVIVRLRRVGSTLTCDIAPTSTPTSFTTINTWTGVPTGVLYINVFVSGTSNASALAGAGLA